MLAVASAADQFEHRPRLCHVRSWNDGRGLGFNMQAERGKLGQYIGKVEPGSPAEAAGLRDGDRIVEVNGSNVDHDTHKQVDHNGSLLSLGLNSAFVARQHAQHVQRDIVLPILSVRLSIRHVVVCLNKCTYRQSFQPSSAPCGFRGCKNRPAPFPGRML